jgi:hypothetical protein
MTKTFQDETLFGFSNFGHAQCRRSRGASAACWKLFDICNFNNSMNFQQSKSPLGIIKAWSSRRGRAPLGRRLGQDFYFMHPISKCQGICRHLPWQTHLNPNTERTLRRYAAPKSNAFTLLVWDL